METKFASQASISSTRTLQSRSKQKNSHVDKILTDLEPLIKETNRLTRKNKTDLINLYRLKYFKILRNTY